MSWIVIGIGLDWVGLDWIGLDWIGQVWIGLGWSTLGRIGPDWTGLDRTVIQYDRPTRLAHLFPDEDVILVLRVLRGVVLLRPRFFLVYLCADVRED
jgi:hypothetical protein